MPDLPISRYISGEEKEDKDDCKDVNIGGESGMR